jgi:ribose-phosphate pyrophosphokinase
MAFAEKYRSGGELRGEALVGDVAGKMCVIVDDLISAGSTIARAASACRAHGASRIVACATHGVFASDANDILAAAPVDEIVVTDTIVPWRLHDARVLARLRQVSTVPLIAEAIRWLHGGAPRTPGAASATGAT